ncbi:hypothetical protein [Ferviditalea candida]|uniref:Uncharacterized protein n=1 Tax=Ferviditalea candida TaxID=3108399 RepID=A0ABU5ZM26_9BACL|nr:hypothetical protein [Paenibacillaceae bacterium T2]
MRSLLMTVMLIIAVITIFNHTVEGPTGTKNVVKAQGQQINQTIRSLSP